MDSTRMMLQSPAVAIVGRHNSGKTTLVEKVIAELTARGLDVGSVKHHGHSGFDIDIPGKDSWRHRQAGATEVVISSPGQIATIRTFDGEAECNEIVHRMPGHDLVVVEGYRKSGLPTIEVMRAGNPHDEQVAETFLAAARVGEPLTEDFVQAARAARLGAPEEAPAPGSAVHPGKMPTSATVAVATDIPAAIEAAQLYDIPSFGLNDTQELCDFLQERFTRHRVSVVIQAGGESSRMGRSKATVPFCGRPLIMRLVERLSPVADELIITTNEPENLEFLHSVYPERGIRLVRDVRDERGALPGMLTAFQAATFPFVAVVACDMVFASPRLVSAEAFELCQTRADVVVPVNKHGFEPMHAVYRRKTCLDAVEKMLEQGEKRVQSFYPLVKVCEFPQKRVLDAEPRGRCFVNVNTPEELRAMEHAILHGSDDD